MCHAHPPIIKGNIRVSPRSCHQAQPKCPWLSLSQPSSTRLRSPRSQLTRLSSSSTCRPPLLLHNDSIRRCSMRQGAVQPSSMLKGRERGLRKQAKGHQRQRRRKRDSSEELTEGHPPCELIAAHSLAVGSNGSYQLVMQLGQWRQGKTALLGRGTAEEDAEESPIRWWTPAEGVESATEGLNYAEGEPAVELTSTRGARLSAARGSFE